MGLSQVTTQTVQMATRLFLVISLLCGLRNVAEAAQCACATTTVHVRSGAGLSHAVLGSLGLGDCAPYLGDQAKVDNYIWAHVTYNGQDGWVALDFLHIAGCNRGNINTLASNSSDVQLPGCPRIITRAEWGARPPSHAIADMPDLPKYVFLHHGAGSFCHTRDECAAKVRSYQNYHMDGHKWWDIGYNFVVGEDGNAYEARGWKEEGAHTKGYNTVGIAICVIGDFTHRVPNDAALNTVKALIQCGLDNKVIRADYHLLGHRDVGITACPGQKYYELIQTWPHYGNGTA